jgi:hypothetical protein
MTSESPFLEGLRRSAFGNRPVPDEIKAGGVSQLNPDKRDSQVDSLSYQAQTIDSYQHGETNQEKDKRRRKTYKLFARLASVIKTSEEKTAMWREKKDEFDEKFVPGSKSREEVISQFVDSMTENQGILTYEIYGADFCPESGEYGGALNRMEPHERRLFIAIAPNILTALKEKKDQNPDVEEYRAKAEQTILRKLKLIAESNLSVRQVGKREYTSYSHEAMVALLKIDSTLAIQSLKQFLIDGYVDLDDKVDILNNIQINDLEDVSQLLNILNILENKGTDGLEHISRALIQKIKSNMRVSINDETKVYVDHYTKPFGQLTDQEKSRVLKSQKSECRGLLTQLDYGGDVETAVQALVLVADNFADEEYSRYDQPRIFDTYGNGLGRLSGMSQTVIQAMPEFVFGQSTVGEEHFKVRTDFDKMLARAGLKKEANIENPISRLFITDEFFKGFGHLLNVLTGEGNLGTVSPSILLTYANSMVEMYRKLSLEERDNIYLDSWILTQRLQKLPAIFKPKQLARKLSKVGFSKTSY